MGDSQSELSREQKTWKTRREKYGPKGAVNFRKPAPIEQRLWKHIAPEPNSGCWLWMGSVDGRGYGMIKVNTDRTRRAHIVSYELANGPVPDGLVLDHLCRVTCCANPDHLEPVTSRENIQRGNAGINSRSKTQCPAGHPYDDENTAVGANGHRSCRICRKASKTRYLAKTNEAGKP